MFPATSQRPNDLWRYCQSDLALSHTSFPLASTDSLLYNQSAQPSTQHPCHPARTSPKHLLWRFFLIRTYFPDSNNPPQHSAPMFPPACLPHHILQTWADWNAGRVEEVGGWWGRWWWEGAQGGWNRGLVKGLWCWQIAKRKWRQRSAGSRPSLFHHDQSTPDKSQCTCHHCSPSP